jgi:TonB-dependent SusC/RagA subfamily outer membrane receptor
MKVKLLGFMTLCMAFVMQVSLAQEKTISGMVTSVSDGLPIPGVNVIVKGTTRGVQTDFDGNYTIKASVGETLAFSYVGLKSAEASVGSSNTINMTLNLDNSLDEVVVIAFGTTTKEAFTGSASVINSEELELRSLTNPIAAIEGNSTGVQFLSGSGQPGSSPSIVIRGVGTLNGETDPLYIVDGISYQGGLNTINQNDIESITVLKDAASTALYGSRAANGVVIITTKKGRKGTGVTVDFTSQVGVITKAIDEYDQVSPVEYYESIAS